MIRIGNRITDRYQKVVKLAPARMDSVTLQFGLVETAYSSKKKNKCQFRPEEQGKQDILFHFLINPREDLRNESLPRDERPKITRLKSHSMAQNRNLRGKKLRKKYFNEPQIKRRKVKEISWSGRENRWQNHTKIAAFSSDPTPDQTLKVPTKKFPKKPVQPGQPSGPRSSGSENRARRWNRGRRRPEYFSRVGGGSSCLLRQRQSTPRTSCCSTPRCAYMSVLHSSLSVVVFFFPPPFSFYFLFTFISAPCHLQFPSSRYPLTFTASCEKVHHVCVRTQLLELKIR